MLVLEQYKVIQYNDYKFIYHNVRSFPYGTAKETV